MQHILHSSKVGCLCTDQFVCRIEMSNSDLRSELGFLKSDRINFAIWKHANKQKHQYFVLIVLIQLKL